MHPEVSGNCMFLTSPKEISETVRRTYSKVKDAALVFEIKPKFIQQRKFIEGERIYEFLAGLNMEFDEVRVQILGKEELSSLNEAFVIIRREEGRRSVMVEAP